MADEMIDRPMAQPKPIVWQPVVEGDEQWFRSSRAGEILDGLVSYGFDFRAFMARHRVRVGQSYWQLWNAKSSEEPEIRAELQYGLERPSGGRFEFLCTHLWGLSWVDCDGMRVHVLETCERRLVLDALDLRAMFNRQRLEPMSLRLWREASESARAREIRGESAGLALGLLLDELERYSVIELLEQNEIDPGKFL